MDETPSYYAILNVPREATQAEIKKAYKTMAQMFHPDKHSREALRDTAADGFAQISEAYEVLGHPQKRQVYDIYGKQGLVAGLDVGNKVKSVEELKAEWEKFKSDRDMDDGMHDSTHSTLLQCTLDCTGLLDSPYHGSEIESIVMQSTLDKQLTSHHYGWIGGDIMRSLDGSGGNMIAGCRGMIDNKTGYSTELRYGQKCPLKMHSFPSGAISTSYSAASGPGLALSSTQMLTDTARGTASFVLGPPHEAGIHFGISQRTEHVALSSKVQVGSMYGLTGRMTKPLTSTVSVRAVGRFGFNAIDADIGVVKKLSERSHVTLSVIYGIQVSRENDGRPH